MPHSGSAIPYGGLGTYMQRGFPMHHLASGFGAIDPACHAKYELAWGPDLDRLAKGPPVFKAGELPPATPDPSQMFRDGF